MFDPPSLKLVEVYGLLTVLSFPFELKSCEELVIKEMW